jgi:hypothetical protein
MENIAKASEQQTQAVEQVNTIITQMSMITQQVAANAEESASGSEQLFGLAEELKGMVYAFSLTQRQGDTGSESSAFSSPSPSLHFPEGQDFAQKNENTHGLTRPPVANGGMRPAANAAELIPFDDLIP